MSSGDNQPVQEIVIVRRGHGNQDEGHHGGMWKIAFADFMTAMMAFFLVMWLINATDDKTKEELATYFNPIKLPDQQKMEKALQTAGLDRRPERRIQQVPHRGQGAEIQGFGRGGREREGQEDRRGPVR